MRSCFFIPAAPSTPSSRAMALRAWMFISLRSERSRAAPAPFARAALPGAVAVSCFVRAPRRWASRALARARDDGPPSPRLPPPLPRSRLPSCAFAAVAASPAAVVPAAATAVAAAPGAGRARARSGSSVRSVACRRGVGAGLPAALPSAPAGALRGTRSAGGGGRALRACRSTGFGARRAAGASTGFSSCLDLLVRVRHV